MPAWQVFYQPAEGGRGWREGPTEPWDHHYHLAWIFIRIWTHNLLVMSPEPHALILTYGRHGTCAELSEEVERSGDTNAHTTSYQLC